MIGQRDTVNGAHFGFTDRWGGVSAVPYEELNLGGAVVPAAVRAMAELGADPARIVARTGPAVCGRCYEVPEEMRAEVAAVEPAAYAETGWGTPALDVSAGVHAQLERLGVHDGAQSPVCTRESADHFSYRRDRTTGRLAGYVWLD